MHSGPDQMVVFTLSILDVSGGGMLRVVPKKQRNGLEFLGGVHLSEGIEANIMVAHTEYHGHNSA